MKDTNLRLYTAALSLALILAVATLTAHIRSHPPHLKTTLEKHEESIHYLTHASTLNSQTLGNISDRIDHLATYQTNINDAHAEQIKALLRHSNTHGDNLAKFRKEIRKCLGSCTP